MFKSFSLEIPSEWVLLVKLNRGKANAMNANFFTELKSIFDRVKIDGSIRVVVLSSSIAKFFSVGLDLKEFDIGQFQGEDAVRGAMRFLTGPVPIWQDALSSIEECRKPVIALVNGFAIGGAIDLITACDIRWCCKDSVFSVREVDVGLAADLGTLQRLPKVVGNRSWIFDICLTGRDFGAMEAYEFGLVSKVFDTHEEMLAGGLKLAKTIAAKAPISTLGTKHLLVHARDHSVQEGNRMSLMTGLSYTALWNSVMLQSGDVISASEAVFSKKAAIFGKL